MRCNTALLAVASSQLGRRLSTLSAATNRLKIAAQDNRQAATSVVLPYQLLPFFADCSEALGNHASDYSSVVALCHVALDGKGRRLLMQAAQMPASAAGAAANLSAHGGAPNSAACSVEREQLAEQLARSEEKLAAALARVTQLEARSC